MTAVTLVPVTNPGGGVGNLLWLQHCGVVIQLCSLTQRFPGGFVGWEPHSGRKQSCLSFYRPRVANAFEVRLRGWCVV